MSEGACQKFNNAVQKAYRGVCKPKILSWETNDMENRFYAEVRVEGPTGYQTLGKGRSKNTKDARENAARVGYEALRARYPELNL